ncbi:MAG: sugar ABC transporter permease [Spirochaetaceae bacterium]
MNSNSLHKKNTDYFTSFLFIVPALTIFLLFFLSPVVVSGYYSFFRWNGIGEMSFIGLKNWVELMGDVVFWKSLSHNLQLLFTAVVVQFCLGLFLALFITLKKGKRINFLKTCYFIPFILSTVFVGLLWGYILAWDGMLNSILDQFHFGWLKRDWLGDPKISLHSSIIATCWRNYPFFMILFQAAIVGIPQTHFEVAQIEGVSKVQMLFFVIIPGIKHTFMNAVLLIILGSLKYFDIIFVMTLGGTNHSAELMATYMYKNAFENFRMGYGSTIAMAMFIFMIIIATIFQIFRKRRDI